MITLFKAHLIQQDGIRQPIDYFGIQVLVPIGLGITYIATDSDGEVFGFIGEPVPVFDESGIWIIDPNSDVDNSWDNPDILNGSVYITKIKIEGDWKESLLKIDYIDLQALIMRS